MHPFEKSGCGVAPFRCIGSERRIGPITLMGANGEPTGLTVGAPGQPMGTCDHCGTGIADCYTIRDGKGHQFIVGSSCVRQAYSSEDGKTELDRQLAASFRRQLTKMNHARDDVKANKAWALFESNRAHFDALPHPHIARQNDSFSDYVLWMWAHSGRAGKIKVARMIEKNLL